MLHKKKVSFLLLTPGGPCPFSVTFQSGLDTCPLDKPAHLRVSPHAVLAQVQARCHKRRPAVIPGSRRHPGSGGSPPLIREGNRRSSPAREPVLGALRGIFWKEGSTGEADGLLWSSKSPDSGNRPGHEALVGHFRPCVQRTLVLLSVLRVPICEQEFQRHPWHAVDGGCCGSW